MDRSSYFISEQDFQQLQGFSEEFVSDVVAVTVDFFKLDYNATETTFRGETAETGKKYEVIETVHSIPVIDDASEDDTYGVGDRTQGGNFGFRREELKEREFYPQRGDAIRWDDSFYEIQNVVDNEILGSRYFYRNSIVCEVQQTRESDLDLFEDPRA